MEKSDKYCIGREPVHGPDAWSLLFVVERTPGGYPHSAAAVVCEWRDQGHVMPGGNKVFMDSLNAGCVVAIVVRQQDAQRFRVSGKSRCHPAEFGKHDDHYNE